MQSKNIFRCYYSTTRTRFVWRATTIIVKPSLVVTVVDHEATVEALVVEAPVVAVDIVVLIVEVTAVDVDESAAGR